MPNCAEVEPKRVDIVPEKVAEATDRHFTVVTQQTMAGVSQVDRVFSQLFVALVSSPGDDWLVDFAEKAVAEGILMVDDVIILIDVPLCVIVWFFLKDRSFVRLNQSQKLTADCLHQFKLK